MLFKVFARARVPGDGFVFVQESAEPVATADAIV
jgi:hypothetical protein